MYSIVPCSKSYESRFFIFRQFWPENVIERGICWKKNVFSSHFKVIQGQSRSFGFINFFVSPLAIMWSKWWEYENVLQRYAQICSQLGNLGPFGPTVVPENSRGSLARMGWHPACEWECVDLSVDTMHLEYRLVLFGSECSATTFSHFLYP